MTQSSTDSQPERAPDVTARAERLWRRRALRALLWTGLVLAVLLGGLYLFLRTETGRDTARGVVVTQIQNLLADDATISAERLSGNFLTGARLTGLRIERRGEPVLTADTLLIDYTLRTLLSRTFSASQLLIASPRVTVRQYADSSFNVTGLFVQDPDRDTTRAGFDVFIDEAVVTNGYAEVRFYTPNRDSVLVVRDLATRLTDLVVTKEQLQADIAALALTAVASDGETELDLAASGQFSKAAVDLRDLAVVGSAGTRLDGTARVVFEQEALPVFDADLEAAPLALADVRAFAPVAVYGDPRLRINAESDGRELRFGVRGSLPNPAGGEPAAVVLDGALSRRSQDGPLAYRAEGTLRRLDPSVITRDPALAADVNGDVSLDLTGTTLRTLAGPFSVNLTETQVAGRTVERLALNGRITDGLLRFDLDGALPGLDLVAEGEARPFERVPTVDLRGTARDLDLAALVPGQSGRFAGDFAVEGRGSSVETFYGSAAVSLSRAEIALGERRLDLTRAEVDAELRGGDIAFATDLALAGGGALTAVGSTRLGTETPVYTVERGTVRGLDLAVLTGDPAQSSALTGTFAVDGRGVDPQTLAADVELALAPSRYGDYTVQSARLDGSLRGGQAAFDLAADLGAAGALTAVGTADPFATPLAYRASGRVQDLDVAALTRDPAQASDLTGTYTVSGRGIDPQTMTADVNLRLAPSTFGEYALTSARLDGTLRGGRLGFDLAADLGRSGSLTAVGTADPFGDELRYDARGRVQNLDLAALTRNPDQFSDLTGTYAIQGRGIDPETLTAEASVQLDRSAYGLREIGGADVTLTLDRGAFTVAGDLSVREGDFSVNASGDLGDDLALTLADGTCFRGLDVGELSRELDLATDLDGCFRGTVRSENAGETLFASGVLDLSGGRVNDARITGGEVRFTFADGLLDAQGRVATEGGDVLDPDAADVQLTPDGALAFTLTARPLDPDPSYTLDAQTRALNVSALGGLDGPTPIVLTADLDLTGEGLDPASAVVSGSVRAAPTRAAGFTVDTLDAGFALREGVLRLDSLLLRTDLIDATADGRLALLDPDAPTDFTLQADLVSLAPLGRFTEEPLGVQSGGLNVRVTGAGDGAPLVAAGDVRARQFVYGETAVTGIDGALSATLDRAALDTLGLAAVQGTLSTRFDVLSRGRLVVQEGTVDARLAGGDFAFDAGVVLDGRRDLDVTARLDLDNGTGVIVESGRFALDGNEWTLADEARIALDEDLITIETLRIFGDRAEERITVNGTLDFEGEQNLRADVSGLDIGGLTDLAGLDGLGGTLGAELKVIGTLDSLVVDSRVTLDGLSSRGEVFGDLEADLDYGRERLGVNAVLTHVDGQTLVAEGTLPIGALAESATDDDAAGACDARLTGPPLPDGLDFRADADAFPIDWARPFLNGRKFNAIGGRLDLALLVRGTGDQPCFGGRASLADGRFGVVATGLTYAPIQASAQFQGDRLVVERLTVGPPAAPGVTVEGDITFPQLAVGELDLTITPRDFLAMDTYAFSGIRLGPGVRPLRFSGTLAEPVLEGGVTLAAGDIYVTDRMGLDLDPVTLDQTDFDAIEAEYGRAVTAADTTEGRLLKALRYDLGVTIDRGVWLRSADSGLGFDLEFEGQLQAQKDPYPDTADLFGQIDIVRGNVATLNRRFEVDRGTMTLNGPATSAIVDLQASTDIRLSSSVAGQSAVEVTLVATGEVGNDPEIRLSSDPPLSPGDIASLLVTGQLADNALSADGAVGVAGGALLGSVSGAAEGLVGQIGFDLVEIDVDPNGALVLRLGKYLTSRAFASVSVPVNQEDTQARRQGSGTQLTFEYQLRRWLMLQGEAGGTRGSGAGVSAETSW